MGKSIRPLTLMLLLLALAACGTPTASSPSGSTSSSTAAPTSSSSSASSSASPSTAASSSASAGSSTSPSVSALTSTGGAGTTETAGTDETNTAEAGGGAPVSGQLTVAGSSALLPLIQEAANRFQQANPGAQITVTAGGSGAGRTQVCAGQIDIGNSDVRLSDQEAQEKNCTDAVQTEVAVQAFAPVANKQGPGSVTNLTRDQLVSIFSGKTTNWKDVGGDDQEIVLINRAKGSGTRATFAKFLFNGDDNQFATGASEEDNSETVRQTVAQTPGAISYLGFAYLNNPDLATMSVDGVAPTVANIQGSTWKIGGPGYMITKGAPTGVKKAFIDYVTSSEFQGSDAFNTLGFVPVKK